MKETLHQPPRAARLPDTRFRRCMACLAFLLALSIIGVGLLGWTARPDSTFAAEYGAEFRATKDCPPQEPVASPLESFQEVLAHPDLIPTHHHPLLRQPAPDFALTDPDGKLWHLRDLLDGRPLVAIFYAGPQCIACMRHLSDVSRNLPAFHASGAQVIAMSAESLEVARLSLQGIRPLGFPVVSDPENRTAQAYQMFRRHGTFIVDRDGLIRWVNTGDAPFRRLSALLSQLAQLAH